MTGGRSRSGISSTYLSSTEQLVKGGTEWILTENSLPTRMFGLGIISFDNQIFTTGNANILKKILFIYLTNYSFYFQEVMIRMLVLTLTKFFSLIQTRRHSTTLANWNKEDLIIQWVLLTLMILLVPNFEHVNEYFKHVFYWNCFWYKNIFW